MDWHPISGEGQYYVNQSTLFRHNAYIVTLSYGYISYFDDKSIKSIYNELCLYTIDSLKFMKTVTPSCLMSTLL